MIRYLKREEKGRCIDLWREAFPEDSEHFLEYYYQWKTADNRILVKEDEEGNILSMVHLNPYQVKVKGRTWDLDYIVGVATGAGSRHQGHMRSLLERTLLDMHSAGTPFCYLMPAAPSIYLPFGFRFVFDQPLWKMKENLPGDIQREAAEVRDGLWLWNKSVEQGADGNRSENLASWMNQWLEERFQVYAVRDRPYLERLMAELSSESGELYGWYDSRGKLKGIQAFWGIGKREQRFLYSMEPEWVELAGEGEGRGKSFSPAMMARITNAAGMMEVIRLREEAPCDKMEVLIRIRDELIPGNQGLWRWEISRDGSRLKPEPVGISGDCLFSTEVLDIDIASLTSWLFGYRTWERLSEETGSRMPWWCRLAEPLQGIFLDEIV